MSQPASGKIDLAAVLAGCQERLRAFIRKRVFPREDAEDVLQEVLYQFVRVNMLVQPVEQAAAWLFRVARNEITDRSRKKREVPLSATQDDGWPEGDEIAEALFAESRTPEDEYLSELVWCELESALEELPEEQREAYVKTEFQGYSFKELAEETGVNLNTLLSRKRAATLHLRERLEWLREDILDE